MGGKPAIMANATPWGKTMTAPVIPAIKSALRVLRFTSGHHLRNGKRWRTTLDLWSICTAVRWFTCFRMRIDPFCKNGLRYGFTVFYASNKSHFYALLFVKKQSAKTFFLKTGCLSPVTGLVLRQSNNMNLIISHIHHHHFFSPQSGE